MPIPIAYISHLALRDALILFSWRTAHSSRGLLEVLGSKRFLSNTCFGRIKFHIIQSLLCNFLFEAYAQSRSGYKIIKKLLLVVLIFSQNAFCGEKVRVGSSPVVSSVGIYLADAFGYFRDEGLDVEITDIANSGAPMTLLLSKGELDVGGGNLTAGLFNAMCKGQKIKLVADKGHIGKATDYISLVVRKDHVSGGHYKDLSSLKGFKIGLTALDGVSQQIIAERFLGKAGLSEKDIEFVKMSYPEMNSALKAKGLDAAIQLEPFVTQAEIGGIGKAVAFASEIYPDQQSAAILYSPQFMKSRERAVKFMVAYLRGIRLYNQSLTDQKIRFEVFAQLKKRLNIEDEIWSKMTPVGLSDNGELNMSSLNQDLEWYRAKNYLLCRLQASDIVDTSVSREAVQILDKRAKRK